VVEAAREVVREELLGSAELTGGRRGGGTIGDGCHRQGARGGRRQRTKFNFNLVGEQSRKDVASKFEHLSPLGRLQILNRIHVINSGTEFNFNLP
jgi:hypothetical protein